MTSTALAAPVPGARLPKPGAVTSFGYQRSGTHRHQGVDLGAPEGTPVLSVSDGVVTHASTALAQGFSGYGRVVVVEASGAGPWFLYAHLDQVEVGAGSVVHAGQQLGTVGRTCFTRAEPDKLCGGGAHLHFEASPRPYPQASESVRLDPSPYLAREGVRPFMWGAGTGIALAAGLGAVLWWLTQRERSS